MSSEKPPTPLECLVCALWSLILIIKLSLQHEPWVANSGAPGSSALNQSNQVLHWRTFFSFFNQVVLILPYHIFIIMLVPSLMEWKFTTSRSCTWSSLNFETVLPPWICDLALKLCRSKCFYFVLTSKASANSPGGLNVLPLVLVNKAFLTVKEETRTK